MILSNPDAPIFSRLMGDPIELAAIERGSGTPVAMVHGGVIHSGPAWARSIGPLADAGFRVLAVDRRGHGRSDAGDDPKASVHTQADDLRLTLELRDAKQAHLVGVSYGALVCLEFALSWPDRPLSLTLIEPPLLTWLRDDEDYRPVFDKFAEVRELAKTVPLQEWFPQWMGLIDSEMAKHIHPGNPTWELVERNAELIFKEETGWEYEPDEEKIASVQVPTMVLGGEESEPAMQELARLLAKKIPGAIHYSIPGGGHDLHARVSDVFNELLVDHFAKAEGAAG